MRASVPTAVVDNTYENFPQGNYDGEIREAELRDVNNDGSWLTLKVGVDNITPREGTANPGRDRFQSDITIRTDGVDLFEVTDFSNPDLPFGIRRAAGLLAGLGEGLGVAERTVEGVSVDLKAVAEALIDGKFKGERVGFEVTHYTNKKDKTFDQYNRFGAAS